MKLWKILTPIAICLILALLILPGKAEAASSGTCGENLAWTLDDAGTLTISGTGPMEDYDGDFYKAPWIFKCSSIKNVVIEDGVTTIGTEAFYGCYNLTSVMIGSSVTAINNGAFWCCVDLTGITIPVSVTTIGKYVFADCTGLTEITISGSVTTIGDSMFANCSALNSVTIPNSVIAIDGGAFFDCDSLTSVTIPDGVTTIGSTAFCSCDSLTSVTIPNSVTTIGDSAFRYCSSLTDVWYTGSQTDRYKISIADCNSYLISATWYYDACPIGAEHTYDNNCDSDCNVCGKTRTTMHTYDGNCDADCNVCKTERTPPHAPGAELIHDETAHWRECTLCKEKLEQQAHIDNGEGGCTACDWKAWISGDMDDNETLSTDDAVYLLLHVMFGAEDYPAPDGMLLDLNADGAVDTNDAVYLLLHVMFGEEDYPLAA